MSIRVVSGRGRGEEHPQGSRSHTHSRQSKLRHGLMTAAMRRKLHRGVMTAALRSQLVRMSRASCHRQRIPLSTQTYQIPLSTQTYQIPLSTQTYQIPLSTQTRGIIEGR